LSHGDILTCNFQTSKSSANICKEERTTILLGGENLTHMPSLGRWTDQNGEKIIVFYQNWIWKAHSFLTSPM
jgi:hypothetical protein